MYKGFQAKNRFFIYGHLLYMGVNIVVKSDLIIVKNIFQKKNKATENEKFGLNYLQKIYHFYQVDNFSTKVENEDFICFLPYIEPKYPFTPKN